MRKIVIGLCLVSLLLAGCGAQNGEPASTLPPDAPTGASETQPEAQPQEQVTVSIALFDWERANYEGVIATFEEENPDIDVQIVSANEVLELGPIAQMEFPDDAERRLVSAADVVNMGVSRDAVEQGLVRDLTPFIEADPSFAPEDFYPNALPAFQWDGGTWAVPTSINLQVIFYDKDLFDQAGVAYPQIGWTWEDLRTTAQAVTRREGGDVAAWGFVPASSLHRTIIESLVGPVIDDSTSPPAPRFDEPDVIEGVSWYANLFLKDQISPYIDPEANAAVPQNQALIDKGQAAMWPETDILWSYRIQQANIGVVPFPVHSDSDRSTPAQASSLAMSAGTAQPEAAWRFLDYVSRQSIAGIAFDMKSIPARQSVAETTNFWGDADPELATALRFALDHSYSLRTLPGHQAFQDALNTILQGEQGVEQALTEAQSQAIADIDDELSAQAQATPVSTVVVAPSEPEPSTEGATTIVFTPGLGSFNLEPYRDLARQFHDEHPEIVVEVKMADFMSGETPDLASMATEADCFQWFPTFQQDSERAAILSLTPFLDADPSFTTEDFFPNVLEDFFWQGQIMGLPADVLPYVIEYNRDLFTAAGVDVPQDGWNWEDFLATAVALTEGEDETKQYGFVAEAFELNDLVFMLERLGAKLVDESAEPPRLSFDDPATVDAVRWYATLSTEHKVKPVFVTDLTSLLSSGTAYLEREALINDGRAAMWPSSSASAILGSQREFEVGVVPLPVREGALASSSYSQSSGYFISEQTENRQACWQWITFLTSQPSAAQGLPCRRSVAESDAYRELVGAERADAYLASVADAEIPSGFQAFSSEEWLGVGLFWLGQAYGQIISGEANAEDAMATAQMMADDYRACMVAADDFSEEAWQTCAKDVDPTLPDILLGID